MPESHMATRWTPVFLSAAIAALVLAMYSCAPRPPKDRNLAQPDLLLISLDTLRADRLGAYGYDRDTSPFLDQLAAEGVRFENAFVNTHGTPPSHATLFTSTYQETHRVSHSVARGADPDHRLPPGPRLLQEVLRDAGYTTLGVTGGGFMSGDFGFDRGFDTFKEDSLIGGLGTMEKLINRALDQPKPIFAFFHTYEIHSPYSPPSRYRDLWGKFSSQIRPTSEALRKLVWAGKAGEVTPDDLAFLNSRYDAGIRFTDDSLSDFFDRLDAMGFLDNALVIITSDHGEEFGEHGGLLHPGKLYDELLHVPLIIAGPASLGVEPGRIDDALVSTLDIAPTFYAVAGVEAPEEVVGRDLLAFGEARPRLVFTQYGDLLHGVRTER